MGGAILTAIGKTAEEATEIADSYEDVAFSKGLTDVRHRSEPIQINQIKRTDLPAWIPDLTGIEWIVFLWVHS